MNVRISFYTMEKFKELDLVKTSGIYQIFPDFFKTDAPVKATHLANITNLSVKFNTFPSRCKIAKTKPKKREFRLKLKIIDLFLHCL